MNLYDKFLLPALVNSACKVSPKMKQREKVIPLAHGRVLEIGVGSGLNLPFYNTDKVDEIIGIDPSEEMWSKNNFKLDKLQFEFIKTGAESLPFENNFFDCVVSTYSLCTIPDYNSAMEEIRRVINPKGIFIFCEHGKAPDKKVAKWQNRLDPMWSKFGGGCHLNRDIPEIIINNGFKMDQMDQMFIPGWKIASYEYWGKAKVY